MTDVQEAQELVRTHLYKKRWSPSELQTLKWCPRSWKLSYLDKLALVQPIDYLMMFGSMYHEAAAGIDKGLGFTGALDDYCARTKASETYILEGSRHETVIEHCRDEIVKQVVPAYLKFLNSGTYEVVEAAVLCANQSEILTVEEMLIVEWPNFIIKCIPDKVIRDPDRKVWVVERKSTSRDDAQWLRQWQLNLQTTIEVICVEQAMGEPVEGVLIEQLVVTRKRSKNWAWPWPQPINNLTFHPWRPVPKSQFIKEQALQFVEDSTKEYWWRKKHTLFDSMNPNSCTSCNLHALCRGSIPLDECMAPKDPHPYEEVMKTTEIIKARS